MPEIQLIEESHQYLVDDKPVKSVTQLLKEYGLSNYWNNDPWYLERGTAVHRATHFIDIGDLDFETVDPQIMPYLEAYMKFKQETGWVFKHIEEKFYHPIYHYCGTPDRFLPLLDIKTGEDSKLQLAAYGELLRTNGHNPGREAFNLRLDEDGTYSLKSYLFNKTDTGIFLCCANINHYKENLCQRQ